jgi:hypothetical protein
MNECRIASLPREAARPCNRTQTRRVLFAECFLSLCPPRHGHLPVTVLRRDGMGCVSSSRRTQRHDWASLLPAWPGFETALLACCATEVGVSRRGITEPRTLPGLHRRPRWALGGAGLLSCLDGLVFPASPWSCTCNQARAGTSVRGQCCTLCGAQRSAGRELGTLS